VLRMEESWSSVRFMGLVGFGSFRVAEIDFGMVILCFRILGKILGVLQVLSTMWLGMHHEVI
jgi:hypothetical protein